ncbi:hypothetical protein QBC44DRAFT_331453 [Cladorrhinum sp. PSN332]|nr:hypothetical protein QBC44DRAFT_331453 [Cladorrhinum sp. PSN332]
MAPSPIVIATIQAAVITAISNLIAQAISAQQENKPLTINLIPTFQFILFAIVSTPPNFLWQEFLESTFPGYHPSPTSEAVTSASANNEAELDDEAEKGRLVEPKLNKANTAIKTVLDQTVGAAVNTLMFSLFMGGIREAMAHHHHVEVSNGLSFLFNSGGKGAIRYGDVNWAAVWERAMGEFWSIVVAGWRFWPAVSLVNFVFLKSVEARNLLGSLAGLGWGVYISLISGK